VKLKKKENFRKKNLKKVFLVKNIGNFVEKLCGV